MKLIKKDIKHLQLNLKLKNGQQVKKKPYYYASTGLSKIKSYKDKINAPVPVLYNKKSLQF